MRTREIALYVCSALYLSACLDSVVFKKGLSSNLGNPGELVVAIGKMGRTTVSCDGGQHWILNQSMDDQARCWIGNGPECDHHPGSGTGIAYDQGTFVATFGWGYPGPVKTTQDGFNWNTIPRSYTTTGPAGGGGVFIAFGFQPHISTDLGANWNLNSGFYLTPNPRRVKYLADIGTFIVIAAAGDGSANNIARSTDGGQTWQLGNYTTACTSNIGGIAYGNGTIIVNSGHYVQGSNRACRSIDGGQTWMPISITSASAPNDAVTGSIAFTDGRFVAFGSQTRFSSTDGINWTGTPMIHLNRDGSAATRRFRLEIAHALSSGVLVGMDQSWGSYYEAQRFARSTDGGITWQESMSYIGSHPITDLASGPLARRPPFCD